MDVLNLAELAVFQSLEFLTLLLKCPPIVGQPVRIKIMSCHIVR